MFTDLEGNGIISEYMKQHVHSTNILEDVSSYAKPNLDLVKI